MTRPVYTFSPEVEAQIAREREQRKDVGLALAISRSLIGHVENCPDGCELCTGKDWRAAILRSKASR